MLWCLCCYITGDRWSYCSS